MLVHLSFLHVACVCSHMHSWVHTCVYLCVHMQACVHVHVHMLVYSVFVCTLYGTRSSGSPSQGCWPVTIRTTLQVALQTSDGHDGDSPPRYRHTEEHRDVHKCACAHTPTNPYELKRNTTATDPYLPGLRWFVSVLVFLRNITVTQETRDLHLKVLHHCIGGPPVHPNTVAWKHNTEGRDVIFCYRGADL